MNYYDKFTEPKIEANTQKRIYWNKYLGQSLDSFIKNCFEKEYPEGKVYALIAKEHKKELDLNERSDWSDLLKSNIGSTYSRLNYRDVSVKDNNSLAIKKINELMKSMPKTEGQYLYNLEVLKELLR
jgi:ABC-type lipoprotein release transport system permease subunit